ncbi:HTTM domain-containing protein [Mucilaginibacter defluvii]
MKSTTSWINSLNERFWHTIVNSTATGVESVAVFRVIMGIYLLFVTTPTYTWIADLPKALYTPPIISFVNLLADDFPGRAFLVTVDFLMVASIVGIVLGIYSRFATLAFVVLKICVLSFQYSFGKIDHDIMLPATLACMAFSGWGQTLALVPDKKTKWDSPSKSLSVIAVLIGFGYFSAGIEKAIHWLNFDLNSNGTARWFYLGLYNLQRQPILAPALKNAPFWFFKIMDVVGVIFELTPIIAVLISRKAWRIWLFFAAAFHLVNYLLFNINFIGNGLVYIAFINYKPVYSYIVNITKSFLAKALILAAVGYAAVVRGISILTSKNVGIIFIPDNGNANLYCMLVIWALICAALFVTIIKSKEQTVYEDADELSPQLT